MNRLSEISDDGPIPSPKASTDQTGTLPVEIAGLMSVLLHLIDQRGPVVVYLSAATHGEGTTTIARELAAAASHWDWCKVALIDANPWPTVTSGHPVTLGLLDVCEDAFNLSFRRRVHQGTVLLEAPLTGTHTSVPQVDTVRTLFDRLRGQFTLIIVDSPPVLMSQQTAAFSAAADCIVLVVEAERTRTVDLERARATLEQLGAGIMGIVLNKRRYWVPRFLSRRL